MGTTNKSDVIIKLISERKGIPYKGVAGVVSLLDSGATIPFISRYRKETTGGLDEQLIADIKSESERLTELLKRKEVVINTISEQGKLTDDLRRRIDECFDSVVLEDIYLPYKPKRRTRATVARERGLEPLAAMIIRQDGSDPKVSARRFINVDIPTDEDALDGACDIIAEWVSENERSRQVMRRIFAQQGVLVSKVVKGAEQTGAKYSDYFGAQEQIKRMPSHRLLAVIRGESEGVLKISLSPDEEKAVEMLNHIFVNGNSPARMYIEKATKDSYKRLLKPSMESETIGAAKERADDEAIRVFAENLRQLLLSPALGQKRVLAIDPGFRSGCKVVCLDAQGALLYNDNIFPHPPQNEREKSKNRLVDMIRTYAIQAIAVGDGTAGRETMQLVNEIDLPVGIDVFTVSEDGASVYSASATAREEFPDKDVTVRGAISIGRRLVDPLAELVKIDPKAIGVGQYQHDVDQSKLKVSLDGVVESCVNRVGVSLNTASYHLLSYVSGIGGVLAKNIVEYRNVNGAFNSRAQLLDVPRLGAKAYEQCAGFLRIADTNNPLDNSAVHPESYHIVGRMAKDMGVSVDQLLESVELQQKIDVKRYVSSEVGLPTVNDIVAEIAKPGRDPREKIEKFEFAAGVQTINDLHIGMVLPGIVTNITNFGAFVDIGVKQDGLVHISQLADRYVSNPNDIVRLHQAVTVRITEIDMVRGRIGLSMKELK